MSSGVGISDTSRLTPELLLLTVKFSCLLQFIVPIFLSRETEAPELKCFCSGSPVEKQQMPRAQLLSIGLAQLVIWVGRSVESSGYQLEGM